MRASTPGPLYARNGRCTILRVNRVNLQNQARSQPRLHGVLFAYMQRLTGYSRQHLSRLIAQYRGSQSLTPQARASRTSFTRIYGAEDVALLAETEGLAYEVA